MNREKMNKEHGAALHFLSVTKVKMILLSELCRKSFFAREDPTASFTELPSKSGGYLKATL